MTNCLHSLIRRVKLNLSMFNDSLFLLKYREKFYYKEAVQYALFCINVFRNFVKWKGACRVEELFFKNTDVGLCALFFHIKPPIC